MDQPPAISDQANLSFIGPIRAGVRKNSLVCKFVMLHFHSHAMIGLTNVHFMITNQTLPLKASSTQGVKEHSENSGRLKYITSLTPILT